MTLAKNKVLLEKVNKWKGKVIDKEEKLTMAIFKVNENSKHFVKLEEV